jgi:hypothetical protein
MRTAKQYPHLTTRIFRPEQVHCLDCHARLRRAHIVSRRTVVTLSEVIHLTHWGYRCPNLGCQAASRLYRSAEADQLALPGFTFGLDIVLLVGSLRFRQHQSVDEVHQELSQPLACLAVTISRREILFLFETYTSLLRAATEIDQDVDWKSQVQANKGLMLSVDGIQPDKGNETIYLVRDLLSGRILRAENLTSTRKEVLIALLEEVKALGLPILGVISSARPCGRL